MSDLAGSSAVISDCGLYRYRLDRHVGAGRLVIAYLGVNGSTADGETDDHTVRKWTGFSRRIGAFRYIVGNAFGYRAKDVRALAEAADPVGPMNDEYLVEIISEADLIVPCWGRIGKAPKRLQGRFDAVLSMARASGKPIKCFGLTRCGSPVHPLTLSYDTPLVDFAGAQHRPGTATIVRPRGAD